jgi:hypothetical protein
MTAYVRAPARPGFEDDPVIAEWLGPRLLLSDIASQEPEAWRTLPNGSLSIRSNAAAGRASAACAYG